MRLITSIALLLTSALLTAGGPIGRTSAGAIARHNPNVTLFYNIDNGDLSPRWPLATVMALVREEFEDWNTVPGSTLTIQEGPALATDITTFDEIEAALGRGENPIVFDETDAIYDELGFDPNSVLAFAGPNGGGTGLYSGMIAVIGGTAAENSTEDVLRATMVHEFGHALGLGHSQVNGYLFQGGVRGYRGFSPPSRAEVEAMYFQAVGAGHDLLVDDISGYLALYGDAASGNAGSGSIEGVIYMPDGITPVDGINVVVRDISGGIDTIYTNAASAITCCNGSGSFSIPGLPPGEYTVEIQDIVTRRAEVNAAYGDPIRTNRQSNSQGGVLGGFPGDEEFYNGSDESGNANIDDPEAQVSLTVSGGVVISDINIIFNRAAEVKGTFLPLTWQLPEIQADTGSLDTVIGIVNPSTASTAFSIHGFTATGDELTPNGVPETLPARGKFTGSVRDMFADPASVRWVQVGGQGQLYVFAELQSGTTRSAYWASEGLATEVIMPHVAKNTVNFDNFVSVVNGQAAAAATELTARPDNTVATVDEHAVGYTHVRRDLQDLFGQDLQPVDWATVASDQQSVAAMEYFTTLPGNSQMAALDLNNQRGTSLQFLHIATNTGLFWTGLVYINVSGDSVTATETYYNAAGEVIKTESVPMTPGEKITLLFDANNQERVPAGSSWMEVTLPEGSSGELVGYELFGSAGADVQDVFAGLQGNYSQGSVLDYPHFVVDESRFTAIVATNLGDVTADLEISAIAADGTILAIVTESGIGPNQKVTRLMKGLFEQPVLDNAAWIRADATGSTWAGFMLWGDEIGVRQNLSGIVARSSGGPNNSYETALELEPDNAGIWDVSYTAAIEQDNAQGPLVNLCCVPADGIEHVYKIVLDQPKDLLIAVAPDGLEADLDLFVVSEALPSRDFFVDNPSFDELVDYSAAAGGVESVARRFAAGTHYILVTLFQGDVNLNANYVLQVTERPLVLGTFEDPNTLADWPLAILNNDTDNTPSWVFDQSFTDAKYGSSLRQMEPAAGDTESSGVVTPSFILPDTGATIFDFDFGAITPTAASGNEFVQPFWTDPGLTSLTAAAPTLGGIGLRANQSGDTVSYGGGTASFIGWNRWISQVSGVGGVALGDDFIPEDLVAPTDLAGNEIALALAFTSDSSSWMLDNVRVFNMPVSTPSNKAVVVNAAALSGKAKPKPVLMNRKLVQDTLKVVKTVRFR